MLQKVKIFYGLLAFTLVLGACPDKPAEPVSDTSVLRLSGQVYIQDTDPIALLLNSNNEKYEDNLDIYDGGLGGTGEIKNGWLSYSIIGVPLNLSPIGEGEGLDYLKDMYPGLEFSSEDVNAAAVVLVPDSEEYSGLLKYLLKIDFDINLFQPTIKITIKMVNYMYVDKDLQITADKFDYDYTNPELPFPIKLTSEKINLSLKKGWNTLCSEITAQSIIPPDLILMIMNPNPPDPDSSEPDLSALRPTGNLKMSLGDPGNLNWTLIPSQSYDDIVPQYPEYPEYPDP